MLGFKFEDERQIPVMLFYIKTCLKFTVKGTSDPDAAEKLQHLSNVRILQTDKVFILILEW